jgi:hypothetical protein
MICISIQSIRIANSPFSNLISHLIAILHSQFSLLNSQFLAMPIISSRVFDLILIVCISLKSYQSKLVPSDGRIKPRQALMLILKRLSDIGCEWCR